MKFWSVFLEPMYEEKDFPFPYSLDLMQERNYGEENIKGNMNTGELLDGAVMTQIALEEGDLFQAPISADLSNEVCSQSEDLVAEEIAFMRINLHDELMLYACDNTQDLTSSVTESSPSPSDSTQMSRSANNLINFSTEVTNTVENFLDTKPESTFQSTTFPSGPMIIDNSILGSKESLAVENLSSLADPMQCSSDFSAEMANTVEDLLISKPLPVCESPNFPCGSVKFVDSVCHSVLVPDDNLTVGNSSSEIDTCTQISPDFSMEVTNSLEDLLSTKPVSMSQSPKFPVESMNISESISHSELGLEENLAVENSSSPIVTLTPMQSSPHISTGVGNTVEVLDAKDVSIFQSLPSPSATKRTSNCIHNPMSGSENGGSGVSYSPIPPHLQNLPKMQRSLSSHELGQRSASPRSTETSQYPHSSPMSYTRMKGTLTPQFLDFQGLSLRPSFMPMRRVYSTGDIKSAQGSLRPMEASSSISEDGEFRIGQYTVEERKECLHRYRKKRNKRNFNKKIKYACRKSLADNQPRVRGRFVPKTQDAGSNSAKTNAHLEEDDEEVVCTY